MQTAVLIEHIGLALRFRLAFITKGLALLCHNPAIASPASSSGVMGSTKLASVETAASCVEKVEHFANPYLRFID